jgi:hypothetical protein
MRAQTYRPRVQNGTITKRPKRKVSSQAAERRASPRRSPQRGRRSHKRGRHEGSNLFMSLVLIGALVAAGFVFALRSQINARQLGQAELRLRNELDDIANRQRYEVLEQQRAMSLSESDRAAQQAGLIQPSFNQTKAQTKAQATVRINQVAISRNPAARSDRPPKEGYKQEGYKQRQSDRLAQRR